MTLRHFALTFLALACIAAPFSALAQATPPSTIPHIAAKPNLDGVLDEAAWENAWSMELVYEVSPAENEPALVRTIVYGYFDDEAVNFAFRAFDPRPEEIRAHLSDRDEIGSDDWVLINLDTFNDERRSFAFMVNPLGVQSDHVEMENSHHSGDWDAIWDSAAKITDWGYAVEIRIPFSSLRFQRTETPQVWGIDAVRAYPRSERHRLALFPRLRDRNCYLCQAVKIKGFEGVSPGLNLELAPTLTMGRNEARTPWPGGSFQRDDTETDAGLTVRWGMTPNLTLAGTVNPDFSQVEADDLQLDINNPFTLFLAEKRPFFMEGADFFETRFRLVHTRSMISPSWGTKLTGKEGKHTIGAYVVRDDLTGLLFPGPNSSSTLDAPLELESTASVLRYKRDIRDRHTLGFLATHRSADNYHNSVASFDGDFRFTDKDRLEVQYARSSTEYPDGIAREYDQPLGTLEDSALDVFYAHRARYHSVWAAYRDIGDEFRSDLGFMTQVGHRWGVLGASRTWIAKEHNRGWLNFRAEGEVYRIEYQNGELLENEASAFLSYEGPHQIHSFIKLFKKHQAYGGEVFDRDEIFLHHCQHVGGDTFFRIHVRTGEAVDFTNVRQGRRTRIQPYIQQKIGRHIHLGLDHNYERMTVGGEELYEANVTAFDFSYQFNARMLLRTIIQRVAYDYNVALYDEGWDREYRSVYKQVLFSYKVNPQTVFFLGYTDSAYGDHEIPLTTSNRRIFAKLGYAWTL